MGKPIKKTNKPVKKTAPAPKKKSNAKVEYDNSLTGALFPNPDKEQGDSRPHYRGQITDENGKQFWLAAWKKKSKAGEMYMSLAMTEKQDQSDEDESEDEVSDDDMPF